MKVPRTNAAVLAVGAIVSSLATMPLRAATATWTTSDLDTWVYNNAFQPGAAAAAPTWLNELTINSTTQQFDPMPNTNPARLGSALFAFNSIGKIAGGLSPSRYQINSVTFKATCEITGVQAALYETSPVSQTQILSEVANNTVSWQKPMELYGVGFRAGYTGYEFGASNIGPPLLDEVTHTYSAANSYIVYPIVGSTTPGAYVDVSNSVSGGFSATESGSVTAPFTPTPWAIGTTNLAVGDAVPTNTTFTFSLNLNALGVRSYFQQSLANGAVGVMLSSLHATSTMGGSGVYPRWYTKEAAGFPYYVPAGWLPQLTIDYDILPAGVPGDYNSNGIVDAADYVLWRKGGPLQNEVVDSGVVTMQDYIEWRSRFSNAMSSGNEVALGTPLPEPAASILALCGLSILWRMSRVARGQG